MLLGPLSRTFNKSGQFHKLSAMQHHIFFLTYVPFKQMIRNEISHIAFYGAEPNRRAVKTNVTAY
jgi:hypothetical protein